MTDTTKIRQIKDAEYGDPNISLRGIGHIWTGLLMIHLQNPYLPVIPPNMVALMLAAMKDGRIAYPSIGNVPLDDARIDNFVYHELEKETRG